MGGGTPSENFFFVWTYFVALVMGEQELFTEFKNFRRLPRYGLSKMGPTRAFSHFYRKISCPISVFENYLQFLSTFAVLDLETPFFGFEKVSGCQKILQESIFQKSAPIEFFGTLRHSQNQKIGFLRSKTEKVDRN